VPVGVNPAGITLGVEQVATGLDEPTDVAFMPDTNLPVVIEKGGAAWIIELGQKVYPALMEISGRVNDTGDEQGLLGIAFHPQYARNHYLFVAYTNDDANVVVARYTVRSELRTVDPASERVIITVPHPGLQHNGGHVAFGPDGMLYLGVGDGGGRGGQYVEGRIGALMLGAILRLDVSSNAVPYTIPGSNPFAGMGGMAEEIWLYGLRNPWRFSFDRATGDLYIGDVGEASWEEIDYAPAGQGGLNYGWPELEGEECYPGRSCSAEFTVLPIAVHGREAGCSVVGGYVYRGQAYRDLTGVYFYGDFCTGSLWGLAQYRGAWKSVWLLGTDIAITSFGEDVNGELYLTDFYHGRLYRLTGHR
jgi:glucose/arabinose dehydrogenase